MSGGPIDRQVHAELQETMGAEFAAELVATFLQEAPGMLGDLRRAAAEGDVDGFRRAAHSIKSNAALFGATALAERARGMELGGLPAGGPEALDAIDADYARARAALQDPADG